MAKRVSFSGEHLDLPAIAAHHRDLESALIMYFNRGSTSFADRFEGYTAAEVAAELMERLYEADLTSSLTVLAAIEAVFRIDYLQRCYKRERDPLSRAFRQIYRSKRQHASLEEEIFEEWVHHYSGTRAIIGELRSVFRFRHWLAHGRYWTPRLGRRYDFNALFALPQVALQSLPLYGSTN